MQAFKTLPLLCFFLLNNVVLHHAQQAQLHDTFRTKLNGDMCEFNNPSGKARDERESMQVWIEPHLMYDPDYQRARQELLDEIDEASAYMSKISDELNNNIVVVRTLTGTLKYPLDEDQGSKNSANNSFDMLEMGVYPLLYPSVENKYALLDDSKCPAELKDSQSLREILAPTCPSTNFAKKRKKLPRNIYNTQKSNDTETQRLTSQPILRRPL